MSQPNERKKEEEEEEEEEEEKESVWKKMTRHYILDEDRCCFMKGNIVVVEDTCPFIQPYTCGSILLLAKQVAIHFAIDPNQLRLVQMLHYNGNEYLYEYTFLVDDHDQFIDLEWILITHEALADMFRMYDYGFIIK